MTHPTMFPPVYSNDLESTTSTSPLSSTTSLPPSTLMSRIEAEVQRRTMPKSRAPTHPSPAEDLWKKIVSCTRDLMDDMKVLRAGLLPQVNSGILVEARERHAALCMPRTMRQEWPHIASRCGTLVTQLSVASLFLSRVVAWLKACLAALRLVDGTGGAPGGGLRSAAAAASASAPTAVASPPRVIVYQLPPMPRLHYTPHKPGSTPGSGAPSVLSQLVSDAIGLVVEGGCDGGAAATLRDGEEASARSDNTSVDEISDESLAAIGKCCDIEVGRFWLPGVDRHVCRALDALANIGVQQENITLTLAVLIAQVLENCETVAQKLSELLASYENAFKNFVNFIIATNETHNT
ncbi:hypothetical protein Pelo_16830 [Pelomyxa schiedti]|nr:hypothetical protein Pelo_16830 [Pelomyxa schiedti]